MRLDMLKKLMTFSVLVIVFISMSACGGSSSTGNSNSSGSITGSGK